MALAVSGGGGTRQALAHDEGESILQRRVRPLGDLGVAPVSVLVLDAGRKVGRHARHAVGAQGLDARPLDRFEDGLGRARLGREAGVQLDVVAGRRQCQAVGPAADDRHLPLGRHARGFGKLHRLAVEFRLAGPVADLDFAVARNGAHGKPQHPLERFGRRFLAVGACRHRLPQLSATLAALSGSSSPKQR